MIDVKTYPEMNAQIVSMLRIDDENPICLYAAKRIEELEAALNLANEKKTKGDKIRSMTDEEFAAWYFNDFFHDVPYCEEPCDGRKRKCEECLLKWLKEEADGKM